MKIKYYHGPLFEQDPGEGSSGGGTGASAPPANTPPANTPPKLTDPAGAGAPTGWKSHLSDEFKLNPSLKDYKDTPDGLNAMAKTLLHSQQMIGKNKVTVPTDKSTPEEIEAFFKAAGRPDSPDNYKFDLPNNPNLPIDDNKLKAWKESFHKMGLSNAQANSILKQYVTSVGGELNQSQAQQEQEIEQGLLSLREQYGDNYDAEIDIAKAAVRTFGDDDLIKWLNDTGNASHPRFIKLFNSIGRKLMDDSVDGGGVNKFVTDGTKALQEIEHMKTDAEFQKTLLTKSAAGHKEAKDRWFEMHRIAYPNKSA